MECWKCDLAECDLVKRTKKDMNQDLDTKIQTLAQWLYEARHLVVFTGAGISTESGLPDFRGPDGMWTRRDKGLPPRPMSRP